MAPVISGLSAIFLAPLLALLLGRAELVDAAAEAVATTRAPSLSRCATMMASSWSRTWGGGSSISRLSFTYFRQSTSESRVSKVQIQYEFDAKKCHGLVVVYSQLYWTPSLPSGEQSRGPQARNSAG